MSINLQVSNNDMLKPCITVFGVGGAGSNAVNNMINSSLEGAKFVVANTDSQALHLSSAEHKIQLGANITKGLGAGASPDVGKASAEEAIEEIDALLGDSNLVFITAGMGGGTGTGAAPIIAKRAREKGILTVGVVTKPFHFEGVNRMRLADSGLAELQRYVDTLIVIPNQNLFKIANAKTTFADAFKMADDVLHSGVRGITDLMIMPGLINLDFADIRTVMGEMGKAMMGTGEAQGENRAILAAEAAISNPLLDNCSMKGAKGVLINITGGMDMTLFEVDEAANRIREEVDPDANIIFGSAFNPNLEGIIRVSVVATGIEGAKYEEKKTPSVQPSTIQQMQQLYKNDAPSAPSFFSSESSEAAKSKSIFFSPRPVEPTQEMKEEIEEELAEDNINNEEIIEEVILEIPIKAPVAASIKAPVRSVVKEVEPESLFGRMARSFSSKNESQEEELAIFTLSESDDDDDLVTDEILNIPAYQRRK